LTSGHQWHLAIIAIDIQQVPRHGSPGTAAIRRRRKGRLLVDLMHFVQLHQRNSAKFLMWLL